MNKICTDLEQSKKLAKILPLESADMYYWCGEDLRIRGHRAMDIDYDIPCWSLAALLEFLRNRHDCNYVTLTSNKSSLWCLRASYYNHVWEDAEEVSEDAVDACVALIEKLHELKML